MTQEELLEVFKEIEVGDKVLVNYDCSDKVLRDKYHWRVVHKTNNLLALVYGKHKYHVILCLLPAKENYNKQEKEKFIKSHFYNGYGYSQSIEELDRMIAKKTDELQDCLTKNNDVNVIYDANITNFNQLSHRYSVSLYDLKIVKKGK